jgi:hypothetical protein
MAPTRGAGRWALRPIGGSRGQGPTPSGYAKLNRNSGAALAHLRSLFHVKQSANGGSTDISSPHHRPDGIARHNASGAHPSTGICRRHPPCGRGGARNRRAQRSRRLSWR